MSTDTQLREQDVSFAFDIELEINADDIRTDYGALVVSALQISQQQRLPAAGIDQALLRTLLSLSSTHLITDHATAGNEPTVITHPPSASSSWYTGFSRLVDILVALHHSRPIPLLEPATLNAASKACSECWSIAHSFRGLEGAQEGVRAVANKLKAILDEGGRTYRGERVYVP